MTVNNGVDCRQRAAMSRMSCSNRGSSEPRLRAQRRKRPHCAM